MNDEPTDLSEYRRRKREGRGDGRSILIPDMSRPPGWVAWVVVSAALVGFVVGLGTSGLRGAEREPAQD
jgi:hypothetical protein